MHGSSRKRLVGLSALAVVAAIGILIWRGQAASATLYPHTLLHRTLVQPADHAAPTGDHFDQRINILIPQGAPLDSPVFFYLGHEAAMTPQRLEADYRVYGQPTNVIFIQAEHRGYGRSITAGDQSVPSYVRIDQALADYHAVVQALKQDYPGPWMAAGSSYGGGLVVDFAAHYPDDVKVILSSSGVLDWPFTMDVYDRQVRATFGEDIYAKTVASMQALTPTKMFDSNWLEREFLIAGVHGIVQKPQYSGSIYKSLFGLPTSVLLRALHAVDATMAKGEAWNYATSNAKTGLSHDEALTGQYSWRVWRYEQCSETGVFEVSAQPAGIFSRTVDDFRAECKALFGEEPRSLTGRRWSPLAEVDTLKVPLVYVGGGADPWAGLGLPKDYPLKAGRYFYLPEGRHVPQSADLPLGKEILAEMLRLAQGR